MNATFADVCAFEDVIAKNINNGATRTNWLFSSGVYSRET